MYTGSRPFRAALRLRVKFNVTCKFRRNSEMPAYRPHVCVGLQVAQLRNARLTVHTALETLPSRVWECPQCSADTDGTHDCKIRRIPGMLGSSECVCVRERKNECVCVFVCVRVIIYIYMCVCV